jgi:hypothetical protein
MPNSEDAAVDMDLLAASLRANASDLGAFVESLATKLEAAVPGNVTVHRWRTRLLGPKEVRKIRLDAGGRRLELRRGEGNSVQTSCSRLSGGIVLKREDVDMEAWLDALSAALAAEAQRSQRARRALERLLIE